MIGEHLDRYEVLEEVGQGGMSVVYRGHDRVLKREVAIKVLHPHLQSRAESRARFEREAVAVAKLSHNNILQIYDFSTQDARRSYIVTEFLCGRTLRDFIEEHPVEHPELAAMIGLKVCAAVQHAHDLHIIHRDIKPENVMVCDDGGLKLMDFGIAQIVDAHAMTVTGTLLGSPAHMSPEMIEGAPLDYRADVFSMGTLIYFAATGELPFIGNNPPLVLKAILEGQYTDAEMLNPRVGRKLSRIIDKCLELDPEDRHISAGALGIQLENFLADVHLKRVDEWLTDFLTQPAATHARMRIHLLKVLEERGRDMLEAGRVAAALDYFNRALAIDPEHEQILALIRNIDRKRRVVVYLSAAALLLVASTLVVWVSGAVGADDPASLDEPGVEIRSPLPPEIRPQTQAQVLASDVQSTALSLARGHAERALEERQDREKYENLTIIQVKRITRDLEARAIDVAQRVTDQQTRRNASARANGPNNNRADAGSAALDAISATQDPGTADAGSAAPDNAPLSKSITVRINIKTPKAGARAIINGVSYLQQDLKSGVTVPRPEQGATRIIITHPIYKGQTLDILPGQRETVTRSVVLSPKPGYLVVKAGRDRGAYVYVYDGSTQLAKGQVGTRIPIPIEDTITAQRTIRLKIFPSRGGKFVEQRATITAGSTQNLNITFR